MRDRKPNIPFSGVGLAPEQRAFVNSVINGKGFKNPLEDKLRSIYGSVVRNIEKLNEPSLFGGDAISLDYQDLFQLKLENLQIAIVEYWKHSNKLSGVVDSEITEINQFDAIYATTTPPPPRKKIYGTDRNASLFPEDRDKVGCLQNIAEFYDRLITSVNYCTARSEMSQTQDCDFAPFGSLLGDAERILIGVDRGVECGPGCCDPCTPLPCTGLEPVCFGLDGLVDHIVSVKNSVSGQRGIDSALQLAYQYSLGVDRLTAELQCLINRDDINYCKETKYAERFALARRIANDLSQGDSNVSQILNSIFNDRFVLKRPISPKLILDEKIRLRIQQLLRSKELSKLKYDEPDDTCGCKIYEPPDPPVLPRRRRPKLPPAPVTIPRIPPPLPPPPARFRAPQLPSAVPPLIAPPPFIFVSPVIGDEGGGETGEGTSTPPPDGTTPGPGDDTTLPPPGGGDGWWRRSLCCGGSRSGGGGGLTDGDMAFSAESNTFGGELGGGGARCVTPCIGRSPPCPSGWQFTFCRCPGVKRASNPRGCGGDTPDGDGQISFSTIGQWKLQTLPPEYASEEDYYQANT